jgi:hypothetical protein
LQAFLVVIVAAPPVVKLIRRRCAPGDVGREAEVFRVLRRMPVDWVARADGRSPRRLRRADRRVGDFCGVTGR